MDSNCAAGMASVGRACEYAAQPAELVGTTVFDWSLPPARNTHTIALCPPPVCALAAPMASKLSAKGEPALAAMKEARRRNSRRPARMGPEVLKVFIRILLISAR